MLEPRKTHVFTACLDKTFLRLDLIKKFTPVDQSVFDLCEGTLDCQFVVEKRCLPGRLGLFHLV